MPRMLFSEVVGTMSFLRPQCDDDFVDRLHYYYTPTFLLVIAVLISLKMFGGSPIECWMPAEFTLSWKEYTELVCWSMSTYFVPRFNSIGTGHNQLDGVGDGASSSSGPGASPLLSYYQWTPFFLVLSALLSYSPCVVWRGLSAKSGLVLNEIVAFAKAVDRCPTLQNVHLRAAKLRGISVHLSSSFRRRFQWYQISRRKEWSFWESSEALRFHRAYLAILYMAFKMLFLAIVFVQACLMNHFLQTDDYDFYGIGVLRDLLQDKVWSDSGNFPRVTFCDIDVRVLGKVRQRYTVQCLLVINIFTEKVFVLLWIWYSLLLLITLINLFGWLLVIFPFTSRRVFVIQRLQMFDMDFELNNSNKVELIDKFVRDFLSIDGCFVLRMLHLHTFEWISAEIADNIWADFVRETNQKEWQQNELPEGDWAKGREEIEREQDDQRKEPGHQRPNRHRRVDAMQKGTGMSRNREKAGGLLEPPSLITRPSSSAIVEPMPNFQWNVPGNPLMESSEIGGEENPLEAEEIGDTGEKRQR